MLLSWIPAASLHLPEDKGPAVGVVAGVVVDIVVDYQSAEDHSVVVLRYFVDYEKAVQLNYDHLNVGFGHSNSVAVW